MAWLPDTGKLAGAARRPVRALTHHGEDQPTRARGRPRELDAKFAKTTPCTVAMYLNSQHSCGTKNGRSLRLIPLARRRNSHRPRFAKPDIARLPRAGAS